MITFILVYLAGFGEQGRGVWQPSFTLLALTHCSTFLHLLDSWELCFSLWIGCSCHLLQINTRKIYQVWTSQGSFQSCPESCPKYFQWCILLLNRHGGIKNTCIELSISFFSPHVSNKCNNRRSLESGFDVTQSCLCSSSNLSIYKLLPRLSSKPLTCTAFRQNLNSGCSAFQPGTRGLFNQLWVWVALLALTWCLHHCKPAVGNLIQDWFHSGHARSLETNFWTT